MPLNVLKRFDRLTTLPTHHATPQASHDANPLSQDAPSRHWAPWPSRDADTPAISPNLALPIQPTRSTLRAAPPAVVLRRPLRAASGASLLRRRRRRTRRDLAHLRSRAHTVLVTRGASGDARAGGSQAHAGQRKVVRAVRAVRVFEFRSAHLELARRCARSWSHERRRSPLAGQRGVRGTRGSPGFRPTDP